jgi:hypothetical protein
VLFAGQVRGGFAMAIGAALYERLVYAEDGGFLTGSFADYAVPTASMIPELEILHQESPSPVPPSRPRPGSCRRLPRSSAAGRASQKCRTTTSKSGAADRERGIGLLQWTALKRTSCVCLEAPLVEIDSAGCSTMGGALSPVRLDVLLTFRAHDQRWAWHIPR